MDPTGQEISTIHSSMEPEWYENPSVWVAAIKAWALTKEGRRAEKDNPQGWSNVIAYGEAMEQKVNQAVMEASQPTPGAVAPDSSVQIGPLAPNAFEPAPPQPIQPAI
jgi:hypothetical protein